MRLILLFTMLMFTLVSYADNQVQCSVDPTNKNIYSCHYLHNYLGDFACTINNLSDTDGVILYSETPGADIMPNQPFVKTGVGEVNNYYFAATNTANTGPMLIDIFIHLTNESASTASVTCESGTDARPIDVN